MIFGLEASPARRARSRRPRATVASAKRAWVPPMSTATSSVHLKPRHRPAWPTAPLLGAVGAVRAHHRESSRPMPSCGARRLAAGSRAPTRSASASTASPRSAQRRTTSPSRSRASGPAAERLGRDVDRRRDLAARARHAPVGDQRDAVAAVLQHAERRGQLVQLGHAVGARALEADHDDHVAVELARLEGRDDRVLVVEHPARRLDRPALGIDRAGLEGRRGRGCPSTSRMPPSARNGAATGRSIVVVAARRRDVAPGERLAVEHGSLRIGVQAAVATTVRMSPCASPASSSSRDHEADAARRVEMVHVARAVGIDARDQRHRARTARRGRPSRSAIPAARAIAGKWIAWLVEPPVASRPTHGVDDRLLVDARAPAGGSRRRPRRSRPAGAPRRGSAPGAAACPAGRRPRRACAAPSSPSSSGWSWRCRRTCRCPASDSSPLSLSSSSARLALPSA